jgi:hypothetical protein
MKTRLITTAVLTLAAASAWFGFRPAGETTPEPVNAATLQEGTLTTKSDPAEVFKRALWRRPAPGDKILHAERREWTKDSAHGTTHWQWFLGVEPGPALRKWLREQNPFAVHPATGGTPAAIKSSPAWFPRDFSAYEVHAGGKGGDLVFLYSRTGDTLYATGSGTGFTAGAPESSPPAENSLTVSAGRLPPTPPPVSTKP